MTPGPAESGGGSAWDAAQCAAALFAVDPSLGGVRLRARHGAARDAWLDGLAKLFPDSVRMRRAPAAIDDGRLLGSIDLAATLQVGRPVREAGLLEQADGGLILFPMSERMSGATAARIAAVMDEGVVRVERDGASWRAAARFGVIALDEGIGDDERTPPALLDRLAFHIDLDNVHHRDATLSQYGPDDIARARARLASVEDDPALVETLVRVAASLGVPSLRAAATAVKAARAACALRGETRMEAGDIAAAARAILAPRATRLPPDDTDASAPEEALPPDAQAGDAPADTDDGHENDAVPDELHDRVLDAARAAIPPRLLESICGRRGDARGRRRSGQVGTRARQCAPRPSDERAARRPARRSSVGRRHALRRRSMAGAADAWGLIEPLSSGLPISASSVCRGSARPSRSSWWTHPGSSAIQRLAEVKGAIELFSGRMLCAPRPTSPWWLSGVDRPKSCCIPTRSLARAAARIDGPARAAAAHRSPAAWTRPYRSRNRSAAKDSRRCSC